MKIKTLLCCTLAMLPLAGTLHAKEKHLLYVASPGLRNYLEYGGMGIVVFDIDDGYKFVKRIPTWDVPSAGQEGGEREGHRGQRQDGRGVREHDQPHGAFDAVSGKKLWDKTYEGGCDRMALSPDGKILYAPSFEGPHWTVVDATTGDVITKIEPKSGSHNTIYVRRRLARVYGGSEVAAAQHRGSEDQHDRRDGGTVRQSDPAVHGKREQHAGVRQRQ